MLTEQLLHFIWQFGYFNKSSLTTTSGEPVQIKYCGSYNQNSGPDFLNAQLIIGNTQWAGNVELHLKSSDWKAHRHCSNPAYNNVVLHVVWEHDGFEVNAIPTLELKRRVSRLLLERYNSLMNSRQFIPCAGSIHTVKPIIWLAWKERLLTERLMAKVERLQPALTGSKNNWEEVLWQQIAKYAGGTVNRDAFESIASILPIGLLQKYRHHPLKIEALLLGTAGLLQHTQLPDDYYQQLTAEYLFLQKKHSLQQCPFPVQFMRMRPSGFPTLRLAQLATLVAQVPHLFDTCLNAENPVNVIDVLKVKAPGYWDTHFQFGKETNNSKKVIGTALATSILINAVVPVMFAYAAGGGKEGFKEKATRWLQLLEPEANSIVQNFTALGVPADHAFDSQALLQLKTFYCDARQCLQCSVGNYLLKN